jgi:carbamoyl-phosphate synthase large subunit
MSRNLLITAASRRVPLVQAFQNALARSGHGGTVVVTDVNPLSPAVYVADRAFRVPLATDPGYVDQILSIAVAERVGLIVPTIDDELPIFGRAIERFATAGIRVAVSPPESTELCNDKHRTCLTLAGHGIAAAPSWLPGAVPAEPAFPLFIKPRAGRGGVGAHVVRNPRELEFFLDYVEDPVVQGYLDGPEFTIDLLCDFEGRPLSAVPRRRDVIRAGVIDRGCTVRDPRLIDLALACARAIRFAGAINIQCRIVGDRPIVFEINPRFSGGIPLTIAAGADFPQMLVELAWGGTVRPALGRFRAGLWMTSFESAVFLDESAIALPAHGPAALVEEVA